MQSEAFVKLSLKEFKEYTFHEVYTFVQARRDNITIWC